MTKIKICGLQRIEDTEFVNIAKPEYVGFILTKGFSRSITAKKAKILRENIDKNIKTVGVFVDDDRDYIENCVNEGIIDLIQLHSNESPEFCKNFSVPVIKAFKCSENAEQIIKEYSNVDYFLFDSGKGSGKTFNWDFVPRTSKKFFLAGGISVENVQNAILTVNPFCVDMSSSVETNGYKDKDKILELVGRIRNE